MLSVEVTADFIAELKLPIEPTLYAQAMRLTRACLEVKFFPYRNQRPDPAFTWEFPKYWPKYRASGGVLTDRQLNDFSRTYEYLIDQGIGPEGHRYSAYGCYVLPFVWNELTDWIVRETADRLEQWFFEFFRGPFTDIDSFHLLFLRDVYKPNARFANPFPLGERERRLIKECVDLFREKRHQLSKRFEKLEGELERQQATPWDAAIETIAVDSGVHVRYLPRGIQDCLKYQFKLQLLNELKAALGEDTYNSLMGWGYQEITSGDWSDLG